MKYVYKSSVNMMLLKVDQWKCEGWSVWEMENRSIMEMEYVWVLIEIRIEFISGDDVMWVGENVIGANPYTGFNTDE